MQERKNLDMYLLTLFCPKMSNMYLKSFDKIRMLKCEDHRTVIVLVVFLYSERSVAGWQKGQSKTFLLKNTLWT